MAISSEALAQIYPATLFPPAHTTSKADWEELSRAVEGRLISTEPLAEPCFPGSSLMAENAFDSDACLLIRFQYTNESEDYPFSRCVVPNTDLFHSFQI